MNVMDWAGATLKYYKPPNLGGYFLPIILANLLLTELKDIPQLKGE